MDEFVQAIEVIPGRYYAVALKHPDGVSRSPTAASSMCYCIDHDLLYEPFYADFGPLNLGKTYRFCETTARLLQEAEQCGKRLYLCCGPQLQQKANAAVLLGAFQVLLLGRDAESAYAPLAAWKPFVPFRDASCGVSCFNLQVQDCLRGLEKAAGAGFLDARDGAWRFDIDEYEHYEQVENGDLNWIIPGKLVAFSGPAARPTDYVGFRAMVPEDYWGYYRRRGVTAVVRLNKKVYDRKRFLDGGFRHHELYFPDGSCPPTELLLRFLEIAEQEPGALAIHCKAGLGRTGVLICSYIMKHYRFTAEEVIGYIRICRPGSVIGPQQNYLREMQPLMWKEGDAWRASRGPAPPPLAWGPAAAPSRSNSLRAVAVGGAACSPQRRKGPAAAAAGPVVVPGAAAPAGKLQQAEAFALVVDATGDYLSFGNRQQAAARTSGGGGGCGGGAPPRAASASGVLPPSGEPAAAAAGKAPGDLSLMQYAHELAHQAAATGVSARHYSHSAAYTPTGRTGGSGSSNSIAAAAAAYLGGGGGGGATASSAACRPPRSRSGTPQRSSSVGTGGSRSLVGRSGSAAGGGGGLHGLFGALGGAGPLSSSSLLLSRPSSQLARAAAVPSSAPPAAAAPPRGRAPSAPRERGGSASAEGLRATLHTDTVQAASRPRAVYEGHLSQSSDLYSSSWRSPMTSSLSMSAGALSGGSRPRSNIVRVLAPNGQPRKVPAATLQKAAAAAAPPSRTLPPHNPLRSGSYYRN